MMKVLSQKISESDEEIKQMVDAIDIDDNDRIYWNEFLSSIIQP